MYNEATVLICISMSHSLKSLRMLYPVMPQIYTHAPHAHRSNAMLEFDYVQPLNLSPTANILRRTRSHSRSRSFLPPHLLRFYT